MIPPWRIGAERRRLAALVVAQAAEIERLRRTDAAMVRHLPDPLLILGADGRVMRTNTAADLAYGRDLASVLRHPGLRGASDAALRLRVPQRAMLDVAVPVRRDVAATVIPLADVGEPDALLVVLSDRSQETALARMRADFVANASHELRTPLAGLIGFIDTLRGPARDDAGARDRFLGIMADQAARMARLIDDLLSLSRAEMAEHQPPDAQVALGDLIRTAAAAAEPALAARPASLQLDVAADMPLVTGDADQLTQVLQNLIDNAVKYGRVNGTVRVSAVRDGDGVLLAVADDGAGIARVHLPRLTERFYRVDAGRSRAAGGTGLGLAIVKHIVNRHRGRLRIESEEGAGTTILVWMPAAS